MHTNTIHNEHSDRGQNHADIVDIIFKHFVIVSIETVIQRKWREREWKKNRISITKNNIDGRYPRSVSFLSFFFRCCYDDKQKLCINLTQWEDKNVTEAKQRTKNKGSHPPLLYSRHDSTNALLFVVYRIWFCHSHSHSHLSAAMIRDFVPCFFFSQLCLTLFCCCCCCISLSYFFAFPNSSSQPPNPISILRAKGIRLLVRSLWT